MNIILILATLAVAAFIAMRLGVWPLRGRVDAPGAPLDPAHRGRVDDPVNDMVWYEATNPLQIPHVRGAWDRRIGAASREGRVFMVPSRHGCTTWDDRDTWSPYLKGLETRSHYLRIEHSHWRHDMDNDAIAIEFASAADLATFQGRVPAGGPKPFDFASALGLEGAAELHGLLARNRALTAIGA